MELKRVGLTAVIAVVALAGCETVPTSQVEILPVEATVANRSGQTIASINYQPCDAPADGWSPIGIKPIPSGANAKFDLPAPCVNLQAFFANGKLAGSQSGIKREFPFSWVVR